MATDPDTLRWLEAAAQVTPELVELPELDPTDRRDPLDGPEGRLGAWRWRRQS